MPLHRWASYLNDITDFDGRSTAQDLCEEPVRLHAVGSRQSSAALKSTPTKDFKFSDSREHTWSQCCTDPFSPPR
jgi:hypothetical protein